MDIANLTENQIEETKAYFSREIAAVQHDLNKLDIEDMSEENLMQQRRLEGQLAALEYVKVSFLADIERRKVRNEI